MQTKNKTSLKRKALYGIMLLGMFLSAFGAGSFTSVDAKQEITSIPAPSNDELERLLTDDITTFGQSIPKGSHITVDHAKNDGKWMIIAFYFDDEIDGSKEGELGIGKNISDEWVVISGANPNFNSWLDFLPTALLSEDAKSFFRVGAFEPSEVTPANTYTSHRLPWQGGVSHYVSKGVGGHSHTYEYWAYDFAMSRNTEVWASYSGVVVHVTQNNGPGSCNPSLANYGNRVVINNDDGSASLYLHLEQNGARVSVGQRVNRGDLVALSGNSGYVCSSTGGDGAHLHFQVQTQGSSWWTQSHQVIFDPNGEPAAGTSPVSGNYRGGGGCNPNADQVALFVDSNYGGTCVVKGIGNYPNPGSIGIANDSVSSVKVGSNVKLIVCQHDDYLGTCETFQGDDSNLSDNSIGNDSVSSAKVESRGGSCSNGATYAPLQSGYNSCANEGGTCSFSGQASVAYGANNCFFYKTFTNSATCNNTTFGDPIVGTGKTCYSKLLTSTPSAPSLNSPANGQYFNEGQSIDLSWTATGSEYYGEIWGGPGGTLTFGWQSGTSKNIGAQWAGYTYSWHIKAKNSAGESGWSDTWTFTIRPGSPANLSATPVSCSQINLSWSDNSGNEEGYKVYRDGGLIATLGSGVTSYQNTGLAGNTNYSFTVKAYRGSIESNSSNTANATTQTCSNPPGAFAKSGPVNGATGQSASPTLSWGSSTGATSYEYCYDTTNDNACSSWTGNGLSTSKALSGFSTGTTYYWHVRANNGSGTTYSNNSATAFWSFTVTGGGTGINCDLVSYTGVILYAEKNCNKDSIGKTKQFSQATAWIDIVSDFNDITSSIFVAPGWSIKVHEAATNDFYNGVYGGSWRCIAGSMWDLSVDYYTNINTKQIINDTISSVQVYGPNNNNCTSTTPSTNILLNGGFENGTTSPTSWNQDAWQMPRSTFTWDSTQKHSGNKSVKISNNTTNDARWIQTVTVLPNTNYKLSGWIRTENVAHSTDPMDTGATLSVLDGTFTYSKSLFGNSPWTYVSLDFNTGSKTQVTVAARIGMYSGTTTGTAWFDDLKLATSSAATTFGDVPLTHPLYKYIQALWDGGYTKGCSENPLMFCPDQNLDRAQSAVFMLRGALGKDYTPPPAPWNTFVNESWVGFEWAQPWAEGMWQEGLTAGCQSSPLMYCPATTLTRAEASIFGLRMKYGVNYFPPSPTGTIFADALLTDWFTIWAEKAYLDGLLQACGTDSVTGKLLFCPGERMNRGWGAYLIVKAKGLPTP